MARKLLFFLAILCFGSPAFGQYLPYASQVILNQNGLKAAPFAQIIVCTTATCTNSTGTKATVHSNSTGSGGAKTQPFSADQNGNFSFWTVAGTYYVSTQPANTPAFITPIAIGGAGTGSGTLTSATIVGTANQITVTGVGSCNSTSVINCQVSLPNAVILGVDNSAAGTLQLANGSSGAHTIIGSAATTTNTILGFAFVPTTGHFITCTVSGTTCTLTDGGGAPTGTVTSIQIAGTANQISVAGTCTITSTGVCTLSFPAGGVTLPATTTGTFLGNLTGNVTGNASGTAGTITGQLDVTNTPLTTSQDIYYRNGTVLARLPISTVTSGQCLGNNSGAWGTFACSGGSGSGINITVNAGSTLGGPANFQNGTSGNVINFSNPSASNIQATIQSAAVTNAMLVHAATTVAGQTCTLGSTCTIPSTALSDYGSVSATGLFGSAGATITVNGQSCVLGSSCALVFKHDGSGNTTADGLNQLSSTADAVGLHLAVSNPALDQTRYEISGANYTGTAAHAATLTGLATPTPAGLATLTQLIASGSATFAPGSIAPGAPCYVLPISATGAIAGDQVDVTFEISGTPVNIFTVTGYNPLSATGMLILNKWVTAGQVNLTACNPVLNPSTISGTTVTAIWRITR